MQAPESPVPPSLPIVRVRPRVWTDLARIFSTVCNPFLTSLTLFVILSSAKSSGAGGFWWLLGNSAFFTSVGPMLYIFFLYATDRISDLDMSIRNERKRVFWAFTVFYVLGALDLAFIHAPAILTATMIAFAASSLVIQYITRFWKISTHAFGITAPLVALMYLFGREPVPFLVLIPIVCWARVYLKAHTPLQVVAGSALGIIAPTVFFQLFHIG